MMKKLIVVLVMCLVVFSFLSVEASAKELKIGYVDMQKVFTEYNKTKEAEAKLENKGKVKTEERKEKVEGIRRLKDEMELLSEQGKEGKQNEIDERIKELQDFDRNTRNELIREREDIIRAISKDVDKAITDYGKKYNYDLIINKDRRILLFEKVDMDATNDIINSLNK